MVRGLSSFILWRSSSESNIGPDCGSRRYKETFLQHKMVHICYMIAGLSLKGKKKQRLRQIFFRTKVIPSMSWVNDTVEDRTVTFENSRLTQMRIVWHSSTSFPNRRPLLVSCQASTAPHHTTALPPCNLTQHAWKEMLHNNQGQKHTLLKLYWTGL